MRGIALQNLVVENDVEKPRGPLLQLAVRPPGSNRPDLIDNMFHVLNATYCDVYVSKEKNQLEYVGLLLSRATRVEIYDGSPVDTWLEKLATNCVTETVPA
jgi:hypothetical protein